jgi:DeoR/GlpR family transcriptional regulator of sugar metabolism
VALDAGTTTEAVARELATVEWVAARLSALRIVTNSPRIEETLEPPGRPVEVVGVGGALRKDTAARTGWLAELCLKSWNITFDVAVVGTTSLLFDGLGRPGAFACDSEDEARTKTMFLDSAALRCVVMDSSKFTKQASSSFSFGRVDPRVIDLVVTDGDTPGDDRARRCVGWLWESGIAVLEAGPTGAESALGRG